MKDFYQLLGLQPDASLQQIKVAYKKSALKAHPDKGGSAEIMSLINEAYGTLSDPTKREQFNERWRVFQESNTTNTPEDWIYLGAGDIVPFSEKFKNQHQELTLLYRQNPLIPRCPSDNFQPFESNIYSMNRKNNAKPLQFNDIFTFMREKKRNPDQNSRFVAPLETLTPIIAVQQFIKFLSGDYELVQLQAIKNYFAKEIKKINPRAPELLLYEGIFEILLITDLDPHQSYDQMCPLKKITDFATQASDAVLAGIMPLFYNRFFRNLYAHALHLYWQPKDELFTKDHLKQFDGRAASEELLHALMDKLSDDNEDEQLADLIRSVRLRHHHECAINDSIGSEQEAHHYREKAFHLLDWIPAVSGKINIKILVNMFLQIGVKFQQASLKEQQPSIKMADEKLALQMYLTSFSLVHQDATPDIELYVNTKVLQYICALSFQDPILNELIPAVQRRVLQIADIFPFFSGTKSNFAFYLEKHQTTHLIRRLLHAMIDILEYNKTHTEAITLDHTASNVLYQAYEACLKNWYEEEYDPVIENKFRLDLMDELLFENTWTFLDVEQNLTSPWIMIDRDEQGWMKPTRSLPYTEDASEVKYKTINGAELNETTGEITFLMDPWESNRPVNEKRYTLFDLQEMLEKNISSAFVSLDPADPNRPYHPFNAMRFGPSQLCETELLNTMLLTDYVLKFLTTHQEVQGEYPFNQRPVDSMIKHLPVHLRQIIDNFQAAKRETGALHRFWIEAEPINISVSDSKATKNGTTRLALGDLKMVVKKHRMERDIHGELKDVGNEDEGWPIYVLTSEEMDELEKGQRTLDGHAMIFIFAEFKLIYWEHNQRIHTHVPDDYRETLIRLFRQPKDKDGKIVPDSENERLLYRSTKDMARQTGLSHRYSPEFIFAHEFTSHYDVFAQYLPEFGRLKELSKMSSLIRYLNLIRESNEEEIQAINFILQPSSKAPPETEHYKRYNQDHEGSLQHIKSLFTTWSQSFATTVLRTKWRDHLNHIKDEMGTLNFTRYSKEVNEACARQCDYVYKNSQGYSRSEIEKIIDEKRSDIASQLTTSKKAQYRSLMMEFCSSHLSLSYDAYSRLADSFMNGNINPLVDALLSHEKTKNEQEIKKIFPNSSINDIALALDNPNHAAVTRIATEESHRQLREQKVVKDNIETGFVQINLGKHEEPVNLEGKCLWVPASVRHEVTQKESIGLSRHSFFVYGGVMLSSRINVVAGNGSLGGSRVGGGGGNQGGSGGGGSGSGGFGKANRVTVLVPGATKDQVRSILKEGKLPVSADQARSIKETLGTGRMSNVRIHKMNNGTIHVACERPGHTSGFQRMSFKYATNGATLRVVQTAFDDNGKLVRQRLGAAKNNLYDVKK